MFGLRKLLVGISAAAVLVGSGLLVAQPNEDAADQNKEVTLPMTKEANLSGGEMRSGSESALDELRTMLGRLVELREVARQSGDIIKLTCVNDQLLLHKQVVNLAEGSQTELVEAIAQENVGEQKHQYGQVVLAKEKGSTILNDAEGCIGDEIVHLGPTEVSLDAPPIDDIDDNQFPEWDPPSYASPFN